MIPIAEILPQNLYSQDDARFLLGEQFGEKAAKEAILEACRAGQIESRKWRKRYWFTGRCYLEWVSRWAGPEVLPMPAQPIDEAVDASSGAPLGKSSGVEGRTPWARGGR